MGEYVSPQEAYPEPNAVLSSEAAANVIGAQQIVDMELAAAPHDEAPPVGTQGYEYTRQDGTVEHAANRQEAITLCPVLGKLALEDPSIADLLLDIASVGQSKMKEQPVKPEHQERPTPKETRQASRENTLQEDTEPKRVEALQPETIETAQVILSDVSEELEKVEAVHTQMAAPEPAAIVESPVKLSEENPREAATTERPAEPALLHNDVAILAQMHVEQIAATAHLNLALEQETVDHALPQLPKMLPHAQIDTLVERPSLKGHESAGDNTTELEIAAMVDTIFAEQGVSFPDDPVEEAAAPFLLDDTPPLPAAEQAGDLTEVLEMATWADELEAEPQAFYDVFVAAMHDVITPAGDETLMSIVSVATPDNPPATTETSTAELRPLPEPFPAIAITVTKELDRCTPDTREAVAPTLQTIIETTQVLEALETGAEVDTELEIAEAVMAQLETQVATLFEQLSIESDAADIEQFIRMLRRSDFQPAQQDIVDATDADLEHDGTREAKLHFTQLVSDGLTDIEREARQLLGRLIILCSHGETKGQLLLTNPL